MVLWAGRVQNGPKKVASDSLAAGSGIGWMKKGSDHQLKMHLVRKFQKSFFLFPFFLLVHIFTPSVHQSSRHIFLHALNGIYRHDHSMPFPTQMPFIIIIIIKISFLLIRHPPELTIEHPRRENGIKQKTAHGFSNPLRWHEMVNLEGH